MEQPEVSRKQARCGLCVIVLAHNEERRIGACLASLPIGQDGTAVHVVVNGSSDRTAHIARTYGGVTVHDWEQGGKSRSWNRIMFDTPAIEAQTYAFVDGDAEVLPGSFDALVDALAESGANAASGLPANGRKAGVYRESIMRDHGLFGDLYALSGDFVTRMRAAGARLPEDLIGDDGLIGALAKTDLAAEGNWDNARVVPVAGAQFLCEPVGLHLRDLRLQARRMRNYSVRHFQNRMISQIMRGQGPGGLPRRLAEIYPEFLPGLRPRRNPLLWWFDRQALDSMRRAAAA
ncbi:glycosyltransferase family A protein [Altererythrobacter sp.]